MSQFNFEVEPAPYTGLPPEAPILTANIYKNRPPVPPDPSSVDLNLINLANEEAKKINTEDSQNETSRSPTVEVITPAVEVITATGGFLQTFFNNLQSSEIESAEVAFIKYLNEAISKRASDVDLMPSLPVALHVHTGIAYSESNDILDQSDLFFTIGLLISYDWQAKLIIGSDAWKQKLARVELCLANMKQYDFGASFFHQNMLVRLRIHVAYSLNGLGLTMRILPNNIPAPLELFNGDVCKQISDQITPRRGGVCLITGPTGSGKSTTLASFITELIAQNPRKLITFEDPIEFIYPNSQSGLVVQREMGLHFNSYGEGLKGALREAPSIILLGEVRDADTMMRCFEASQTGHLILGTLHTGDVKSTFRRIFDFFPGMDQKSVLELCSRSLLMILCQGLLPSITPGKMKNHRVLCTELLVNSDEKSRGAIENLNETGNFSDLLSQNIYGHSWDSSLDRLTRLGSILDETARFYASSQSKSASGK